MSWAENAYVGAMPVRERGQQGGSGGIRHRRLLTSGGGRTPPLRGPWLQEAEGPSENAPAPPELTPLPGRAASPSWGDPGAISKSIFTGETEAALCLHRQ